MQNQDEISNQNIVFSMRQAGYNPTNNYGLLFYALILNNGDFLAVIGGQDVIN